MKHAYLSAVALALLFSLDAGPRVVQSYSPSVIEPREHVSRKRQRDNKYDPHQGKREIQRRRKRMAA